MPPAPTKPLEELEPHELLAVNTRIALVRRYEILCLQFKDASGEIDHKVLRTVNEAAARTITEAIKVDRNSLAARRESRLDDFMARWKAGEGATVIEG